MSSFATYDSQLDQKIANVSELFYDATMRRQACNDTVAQILQAYDIPEMIIRSTITFDSDGLADKPSDYFRMVKLWDVDDNGVQSSLYKYIVPDNFDNLASTASYFWTEDYVVDEADRVLKCLPITSGELQIRYVKEPTEMEDSTTDSGLSSIWDEVVVLGASSRLFTIANRYQEAMEMERLFEKRMREVYQRIKNVGGIKQGNRLKSVYARKSILGGFSGGGYDSYDEITG